MEQCHQEEKLFKEQLIFEIYLNIIPKRFWRLIIKFRTSNHYLPVETGKGIICYLKTDCVLYVKKVTSVINSIIYLYVIFFITPE